MLPKANYEVVTPDYFKTVGTPLLEGRDFDDHDSEDGEPVAIISQSLAQRIRAAGHSPLGSIGFVFGLGRLSLEQSDRYLRRCPIPEHHAKGLRYLRALFAGAQPTNYVVIRERSRRGSRRSGAANLGGDRSQSSHRRRSDGRRTDRCQCGAPSIQHDSAAMVRGLCRDPGSERRLQRHRRDHGGAQHEIAIKTAWAPGELAWCATWSPAHWGWS